METDCWLIIGKNGGIKLRRSKGSMSMTEVAVKINLQIPDEMFERPHLQATITLDPELVTPNTLDPQLVINTKDLIEQQTGAKIDFKILPVDDDEDQ